MNKDKRYQLEESALLFGQGLVVVVCASIALSVLAVGLFGVLMEALRSMP